MTQALKIDHWENRVSGELRDPAKFNKVMQDLQSIALEDATRSLGLSANEYLCVKELNVPVPMNLSRSVRSLARDWSAAFKAQLQRSWQRNDGRIIYYSSLHAAHLQCAEKVINGDTQDLWAWQQCGLISDQITPGQADLVLDSWCQQALHRKQYQISIWNHLLRSPVLSKAVHQLKEADWQAHLHGLELAFNHRFEAVQYVLNRHIEPLIDALLDRELAHTNSVQISPSSTVAPALNIRLQDHLWCYLAQTSPSVLSTVLLIGLISKEPGLVRLPEPILEKRISQLIGIHGESIKSNSENQKQETVERREKAGKYSQPAGGKTEDSADAFRYSHHQKIDETNDIHDNSADTGKQVVDQTSEDPRVLTQLGGVFWLYNLFLKEPEGLDALLSNPVVSHHGQNWIWLWMLYPLICEMSEIDTGEKNFRTLAPLFSGIDEYDETPNHSSDNTEGSGQLQSLLERTPTQAEFRVLQEFAEATKSRFLYYASPDEPQSFLDLIGRRALVTRRGPWMEVEYSLQEVDINVRRTGLDADPGFLVWLGMVVRFHYA